MALHPDLLAILACPQDKGPLHYLADESKLYNPRLGLTYEVTKDIPLMLIEKATHLSDAEKARLDQRVSSEKIPLNFMPTNTASGEISAADGSTNEATSG